MNGTCPLCYKQLKSTHNIDTLGAWWISCEHKETGAGILVSRYHMTISDLRYAWLVRRMLGTYMSEFLLNHGDTKAVINITEQNEHIIVNRLA